MSSRRIPLVACLLCTASLAMGTVIAHALGGDQDEEDEFSPRTDPIFSQRADPTAGGANAAGSGGGGIGGGGAWGDGKVSLRGLWSFQWTQQDIALGTTEYLCVLIMVVYIGVYIRGRRRNYEIATTFIRGVHGLFCSRFLEAGPASEVPPADRRQLLSRESPSTFLYYATGSRACDGVVVRISLANRHDIFMLAWSLFSPVTDTVTVEVSLDDDDMEPMVFAVTGKRGVKQLLSEVPHIKDYAGVTRAPLLPQQLVCLSETSALMEALLQPPAVKTLTEYPDLLEVMHFTDQNEEAIVGRIETPKKALRLRFQLLPVVKAARVGDLRGAAKMVELALYYIELLHK